MPYLVRTAHSQLGPFDSQEIADLVAQHRVKPEDPIIDQASGRKVRARFVVARAEWTRQQRGLLGTQVSVRPAPAQNSE